MLAPFGSPPHSKKGYVEHTLLTKVYALKWTRTAEEVVSALIRGKKGGKAVHAYFQSPRIISSHAMAIMDPYVKGQPVKLWHEDFG